MSELRQPSEKLWTETEKRAQKLIDEGKRNEAAELYENFARQVVFPEYRQKAWEKAKLLRAP